MCIMNTSNIIFATKTASSRQIYQHLLECDGNFVPKLSERITLEEYSDKLYCNSTTFEAWNKDTLVALVAAYFNNRVNNLGYITAVSTKKQYMGKGIASHLMRECIAYARMKNFSTLQLEVNRQSNAAISLYKKLGFSISGESGDFYLMRFHV